MKDHFMGLERALESWRTMRVHALVLALIAPPIPTGA
jgi:hypothetical protein